MKNFLVTIWAYDHYAKFKVLSDDNAEALEKAILDKLGEKSIEWEYLGSNYADEINRITYEEVINDDATTSAGSIQTEKVTGSTMGAGAS
jgi:hypothetical protein